MTKPLITIHDQATDEIITREMTDAEFEQYEIDQAKYAAEKAEAEAKATAKSTLLEKLGISEDEARLLLA